MDPFTLILVVANQMLKLVCCRYNSWQPTSRAARLQLGLFRDQLTDNVRYLKVKRDQLSSLGVSPEPLSVLSHELAGLRREAEGLLRKRFKSEQVRDLRQRVVYTFESRMLQAMLDLQCEANGAVKAMHRILYQIRRDQKSIKHMQRRGVEAIKPASLSMAPHSRASAASRSTTFKVSSLLDSTESLSIKAAPQSRASAVSRSTTSNVFSLWDSTESLSIKAAPLSRASAVSRSTTFKVSSLLDSTESLSIKAAPLSRASAVSRSTTFNVFSLWDSTESLSIKAAPYSRASVASRSTTFKWSSLFDDN